MTVYLQTATYESMAIDEGHLFRFCLNGCTWWEVVIKEGGIVEESIPGATKMLIADCMNVSVEDVPKDYNSKEEQYFFLRTQADIDCFLWEASSKSNQEEN